MREQSNRRAFLKAGAPLALTAATAGSILPATTATAAAPVSPSLSGQTTPLVGQLGWEVPNLNGNGADVYFEVQRDMTLASGSIDVSFAIWGAPGSGPTAPDKPGICMVLFYGGVSRGAPPILGDAPPAYVAGVNADDPDFGTVRVYNPANLDIVGVQDQQTQLSNSNWFSLILKAFVPADGSGGTSGRHADVQPGLHIKRGDYIYFHMDHFGVGPVDGEMQTIIGYTLS